MRRRAARAAARSVEGIHELATVADAKPGPFPPFIEPCHPTLRTRAPHGAEWLHEIKIGGYRAQLHIKGGQVIVFSRRGHDWTVAFNAIAQAAEALADRDLIMDGEATVFGATGLPDFQALRRELGKAKSDLLTFQAFDLLYLDGYDLRDVALIEWKRLLGLVEIGVIEVHPWAATVDDIEHADSLVFDLDPGEGVSWAFVVETGVRLHKLLESEGFETWPKLTGGKGMHVMAPLASKVSHDDVHEYAKRIARRLAALEPSRYTTSAALADRRGRLFIDYLRNGRGTTAVGAYSPRARPGFPVAAPVTWKDIQRGINADAFTIANPPRGRLGRQ